MPQSLLSMFAAVVRDMGTTHTMRHNTTRLLRFEQRTALHVGLRVRGTVTGDSGAVSSVAVFRIVASSPTVMPETHPTDTRCCCCCCCH
jgi:hypothetical protein